MSAIGAAIYRASAMARRRAAAAALVVEEVNRAVREGVEPEQRGHRIERGEQSAIESDDLSGQHDRDEREENRPDGDADATKANRRQPVDRLGRPDLSAQIAQA